MGQLCCSCLEDRGLRGHRWGEGQQLGSGQNGDKKPVTEEERLEARKKAAAAAEARQNKNKPKGKKKPKPKEVDHDNDKNDEVEDEDESSKEEDVQGDVDYIDLSEREQLAKARAAAAEKRIKVNKQKGISAEKAKELDEKATRDRMIGRITHYYKEAGREPPFGLASVSMDKLKKQLEFAKGLKA